MVINPALRYFTKDTILQQLIRDGVQITVENYVCALWRSELPESLTPDTSAFLVELMAYEEYLKKSRSPLPGPPSAGEAPGITTDVSYS